VSEPHFADRAERGVIDVREPAGPVLRERSVSFAGFVRIAEEADKELVDADPVFCQVMTAAPGEERAIPIQL